MAGNGNMQPHPVPKEGPQPQPLSLANIKLLSGKIVQVAFPPDLTDDELCQLIMEISKNLRVAARVERAQQEASAGSRILVAPRGMRVDR